MAMLAFGVAVAPAGAQENADATPLQPGETVEGDIQSFDQWDVYSFEAEAGETVEFEMSRTGGTGDLLIIIVDPDDDELTWEFVGPDETVTLSAVPNETGTHSAWVAGNTQDAGGLYALTLLGDAPIEEPPEDVIETPPQDPTEIPEEELRALQPGETLDGELEGLDDFEAFTLNATAGDPITVELERGDGSGFFGAGVFDPDGEILSLDVVEAGGTLTLAANATQDGTYVVITVGATEDAVGPYSITLLEEEPREIPDEEIRELQPGETLEGTIDGIDDFDGFVLNANAGESIGIELVRNGGSGVFSVGIGDIDGDLLALDFVNPDETGSISATAEGDGQYIVVVVGVTAEASGPYSLTLLEDEMLDEDDGEMPEPEDSILAGVGPSESS